MKIDITKPVQTRDGRKVTDLYRLSKPLSEGETLIGIIEDPDGYRDSHAWHEDGAFWKNSKSEADLQNVPEETVLWQLVYPGYVSGSFGAKSDAVGRAGSDALGLFKATITEGQDPKAEFVPLEEDE